jgi:GntR family transcriptional regulator
MLNKREHAKNQIENMILEDRYPRGSQLPPEPELAEMLKVSRGTVRLAMNELQQDGIVARRVGAGTFVLRRPSKSEHIASFTKQVQDAGMKPSTKVLEISTIRASDADPDVYEAFLLNEESAPKEDLYYLSRLRCGDDKPLARQIVYLLARDFGSDLLQSEDLSRGLFDLYQRYHRIPVVAEEVIEARLADEKEINLLQMQDLPLRQQIVYIRRRITFDQENMPLEVLISLDRGDFFKTYRYRLTKAL